MFVIAIGLYMFYNVWNKCSPWKKTLFNWQLSSTPFEDGLLLIASVSENDPYKYT